MGGLLAILSRPALAGTFSIEPLLGVTGEYDTNPGLISNQIVAETHGAALFNLPLHYDEGALDVSFDPNGRISNSRGYASLASSYVHLDAGVTYVTDVTSASLQAEAARDASLVHAGEFVSGLGVRRDSGLALADYTRSLTERFQVAIDGSFNKVIYDQPLGATPLVNYRYYSGGPSATWLASERDSLKLQASDGLFESINGLTSSRSQSVQLGFKRQLSEIYTLSLDAGYSRAKNAQNVYFFGVFYLGTATSTQNSGVYSATLTRQGERLNLNLTAARALVPSGLAFLARQDGVGASATFASSERWDYAVNANYNRYRNPGFAGFVGSSEYLNAQITVNYHLDPRWRLSLHAQRVRQQFGPPTVTAASSGVGIDLVRQFLRTEL